MVFHPVSPPLSLITPLYGYEDQLWRSRYKKKYKLNTDKTNATAVTKLKEKKKNMK